MKIKKWVIPLFAVIFLVIFFKVAGFDEIKKIVYEYSHPVRYENIVDKYSKLYNVDKELIYAIIQNESKFYTFAKSKTGSKGLMQVSDVTYEHAKNVIDIKRDDIYDKETNIEVGVWYLSHLISRFKNEKYAILAYNAGPENISEWINRGFLDVSKEYTSWNIPFIETGMYIEKVIKSKEYYSKLFVSGKYK
ncbi:lytic transglycosylase domain-containing protein [Peptoanaerobacter stomatis]|uniref:lytic transglycosylase domain-containing protein n=1 Tax=Peptoanaerobacter stomatis TaxID=796937 RepID=UPI003FA12EA9